MLKITSARGMDWKTSKRLLPLSLFYNANVAFALASLKGVNIPMYIALKRLTPLAVLVTGFFIGNSKPSTEVCYPSFFPPGHNHIHHHLLSKKAPLLF
jgi:solute carrier family 35 protein